MRWSVVLLLCIAGLAAAQTEGHLPASTTVCFECHAPGNDDRPMSPAFAVDPGFTRFDAETTLKPRLVNTWYAEMTDLSLAVDLSAAPSLSFTGGAEPYRHESAGAIAVDRTDPAFLVKAHATTISLPVPSGLTALRLRVDPDVDGPLGPDLRISVTDAVSSQPFATIDDAPAGGPETLHIDDARALSAHGSGTWSLEVAFTPAGSDGHADPRLEASFTVALDAWTNTSLERLQVLEATGPILPGNAQPFELMVVGTPAPGEAISFTSRARLFYEHGDDNPDEALVMYEETFYIGSDEVGQPVLGAKGFVVPGGAAASGIDSVAEAIGYGAAFLMIASILSGGILGKGSRRAMNRLFTTARRRVAFHNFLSYGILAAAFAHLVLFLVEVEWHWAWGLLWGGLGILSLFALGFTGALQVAIIRRWGFASWRWIHFGMAIAAIVFTVIHVLLDGSHFDVRDTIGWTDPLVPDARQ